MHNVAYYVGANLGLK